MNRLRTLAAAVGLGAVLAGPAAAGTLLGFTDNDPNGSVSGPLSDDETNWAAGWSQSVATSNVTVRVLVNPIVVSGGLPAAPANWWITTTLGRGADPSDVVASGTYVSSGEADGGDFNVMTRITLATGLSFAAGTYFLVLDGSHPADAGFSTKWVGDSPDNATVNLAPGFSYLGDFVTEAPADFGPAATFQALAAARNVFELVTPSAAPEPAAWGLMLAGFGLAGAALRSRRRWARAAAG